MDVNFASNDLFDLNVEPACQMLDLSLALSFDDMDEPAAFGVNKLGMRQISFDALPMMQARARVGPPGGGSSSGRSLWLRPSAYRRARGRAGGWVGGARARRREARSRVSCGAGARTGMHARAARARACAGWRARGGRARAQGRARAHGRARGARAGQARPGGRARAREGQARGTRRVRAHEGAGGRADGRARGASGAHGAQAAPASRAQAARARVARARDRRARGVHERRARAAFASDVQSPADFLVPLAMAECILGSG